MDIEEFERQVQPRAKRSRLEPYLSQIFELKTKGYANWQVCEWLAANGVKVSQEAVRKFIKSREGKEPVQAPVTTTAAAPQHDLIPKKGANQDSQEDDDLAGKSQVEQDRVRRERRAQQFIKDQPSNPLLKNLKEKKQ